MAIEVKIPSMGESITSGVLAKWHVKDGDIVKKDQPLFELETDKITSEGTAESAGKITLKVAAGTEVKIGQVVAMIDEAVSAAASPVTKPLDEPRRNPQGEGGPTPTASVPTSDARPLTSSDVSPAVRRLASETGLDPSTVTGTGKAGRVTKGDMLQASETPSKDAAATEAKPARSSTPPMPVPAAPGGGVPSPREATPAISPPAGARQTRRKMTPPNPGLLTHFNGSNRRPMVLPLPAAPP